jgi:hypothetical protein
LAITEDSGVITLWGNEKIKELSEGDGIYTITENNNLVIAKIEKLIERKVEDYEIYNIRTSGFRGKIKCDEDTSFIRKYKDNDGETQEKILNIKEVEKGFRLKELNNSVLYFEFGDEIRTSSRVKSIKKKMFTGSIYDIEVKSEIKGIVINSLVIIN